MEYFENIRMFAVRMNDELQLVPLGRRVELRLVDDPEFALRRDEKTTHRYWSTRP